MHTLHHGSKLGAQWSRHKFFRLINSIGRDTITNEELSSSVRKVIAVVLKNVIFLHAPLVSVFSQELHEELLGDISEA